MYREFCSDPHGYLELGDRIIGVGPIGVLFLYVRHPGDPERPLWWKNEEQARKQFACTKLVFTDDVVVTRQKVISPMDLMLAFLSSVRGEHGEAVELFEVWMNNNPGFTDDQYRNEFLPEAKSILNAKGIDFTTEWTIELVYSVGYDPTRMDIIKERAGRYVCVEPAEEIGFPVWATLVIQPDRDGEEGSCNLFCKIVDNLPPDGTILSLLEVGKTEPDA